MSRGNITKKYSRQQNQRKDSYIVFRFDDAISLRLKNTHSFSKSHRHADVYISGLSEGR